MLTALTVLTLLLLAIVALVAAALYQRFVHQPGLSREVLVTLHEPADEAARGILAGYEGDYLRLINARWITPTQTQQLPGEIFVPRSRIVAIQVLPAQAPPAG